MLRAMSLAIVVSGIPESGICIGSSLPLQELLSMITVWVVLFSILVSGLLVLCQRGAGFARVFGNMRCCLDLVVFRVGVGVLFQVRHKNTSHVLLYFRPKTIKRHVSRTHRVDLALLFDQITWDPGLHIRYGNTNQQVADIFDQKVLSLS